MPRQRCGIRGDVGIAPYVPSTESVCVSHRADRVVRPYALKHRRINFYRGRDQRQRRRRRDDPFVRTTNSNFRDRVAQTADKHRA